MKNIYFTLILSFLIPSNSIVISGIVQNSKGNIVEGVNIYTERNGTSTDYIGAFALKCFPDDIITISHISYSTIKRKANELPNIIILKSRNINTEEIIIEGSMLEKSLKEMNNSLVVLQSEDIDMGGYQHFEDAIKQIPNLNSSGGTSRSRYFQIRGVGELSQFSGEGPPHFYIGYIVDDIDFSGLGMAGLLNDIKQIEVFKGPQSSIYGPNAMAGLINISSNDPTPHKEGGFSLLAGDDHHLGISSYYSFPLSNNILVRFALFKNQSDGFRKNKYLNRTNTNNKDENMFRYKMFYTPSNNITFKLTYYMIDIKNGYDVWATDNNGFNTFTDYIGKDYQKVNAFSLKSTFRLPNNLKFISITSCSVNDIIYNYDGDWGNDSYWKDNYDWYSESDKYDFDDSVFGGWGYYQYMFTDETTRKRDNISQEFRILKNNLIGGIYISQTTEDDMRNGYLMGGNADNLDSYFKMLNISAYSSYELDLFNNISLLARLRFEHHQIESDLETKFYGTAAGNFNKNISGFHWGGKLGLVKMVNDFTNIGISVSKGYKTHGVNQSINIGNESYSLSDQLRTYDGEDAYNIEISYNYRDNSKSLSLNSFYLLRVNPQIRLSYQLDTMNPTSFDFYTVNANRGYSCGIEGQFKIMITDNLYFYDSFAILKSHISSYEFLGNSIGNRTQAHAPEFSANGGFEYIIKSGLFVRFDHSVMLDFYHEDQYESKTDSYQILNASFGWKKNKFKVSLWAKNLLNEKYVVRGMNFALEPTPNQSPYFFSKTYLAFGNPRHIGLTFSYNF